MDKTLKNKGITLVALVITIIILLILAGISIQAITSNNGLFTKAKQAKQKTIDSQELENEILKNYKNKIEETNLPEVKFNARYLLIEVGGVFPGSDGVALNEFEVYKNNGEKIEYTVLKDLEYDSVDNGKSSYWENMTWWNYTNLNDGEYEYRENYPTGGNNCTLFINHGNIDSWARFIIDLGSQINIGRINIAVGGYDEFNSTRSRTPKKVTIYNIDNFIDGTEQDSTYINNIMQRNDIGLSKIAEKEINEVLTTVTEFSLLNN